MSQADTRPIDADTQPMDTEFQVFFACPECCLPSAMCTCPDESDEHP